MKNQVLTSMIALGFAALLGSTPAAAQARQTATIPFSFEAGGVEYSEGQYAVERMTNNSVIKLTNLINGRSAMVFAPVQSGKDNRGWSKLVFSQLGDRMKLNEVWFQGYPGMLTGTSNKEVSARVVVGLK